LLTSEDFGLNMSSTIKEFSLKTYAYASFSLYNFFVNYNLSFLTKTLNCTLVKNKKHNLFLFNFNDVNIRFYINFLNATFQNQLVEKNPHPPLATMLKFSPLFITPVNNTILYFFNYSQITDLTFFFNLTISNKLLNYKNFFSYLDFFFSSNTNFIKLNTLINLKTQNFF